MRPHKLGFIGIGIRLYRLVQKKCSLFEFPAFLLPTNLRQPMRSQSALMEIPSLNLACFILLNPVQTLMVLINMQMWSKYMA